MSVRAVVAICTVAFVGVVAVAEVAGTARDRAAFAAHDRARDDLAQRVLDDWEGFGPAKDLPVPAIVWAAAIMMVLGGIAWLVATWPF